MITWAQLLNGKTITQTSPGNATGYLIKNNGTLTIQDNTDGELPDINKPMLGVNLASASGGSVPGNFGTDYKMPNKEDLYYFKAKGCRLIRFPFRMARLVEDIDADTLISKFLDKICTFHGRPSQPVKFCNN